MIRKLGILAGLAILLGICSAARAQETAPPPSLGDVARKNREEKAKNPQSSKHTLTNDDIFTSRGVSSMGSGAVANEPSPRGQKVVAEVLKKLDVAELAFQRLDSMDRAQLGLAVLRGDGHAFPGREAWEERLYLAKNLYVSHERTLGRELRQLMSEALALEAAKVPETDPRFAALEERLKTVSAGVSREEAAFNAVIAEGRELAKQQEKPTAGGD